MLTSLKKKDIDNSDGISKEKGEGGQKDLGKNPSRVLVNWNKVLLPLGGNLVLPCKSGRILCLCCWSHWPLGGAFCILIA